MIQPAKIANVMGGKKVLHGSIRSLFDLERAVEKGLPKGALKNLASFVSPPREQFKFIYQVVPEGTYKRRHTHLSPEESERTERIARVIATAIDVWEDREKAKQVIKHALCVLPIAFVVCISGLAHFGDPEILTSSTL